MAAFFTTTTETIMGETSITGGLISTITDAIILLRYVEVPSEVRRGLTVLKMRGSRHDKRFREFTIDDDGMHIGAPFRGNGGVLTGRPLLHEMPENETGTPRGSA